MDAANETSKPKPAESAATRRERHRKWSKWLLAAILVYSIYPITVTVALSTGVVERMLASEDLRVEISAPAWSLIPGDIHMGRVRVFMNGETQFYLSADNITAQVRILPLFRQRFEVSSLATKNVVFQMRVQLDDDQVKSPRAQAFPPLPGLPGDPTLSRQAATKTEERGPNWTVRLDGIDVKVSELWFMEYRYQGDGRLQGGFERGPDILRIDTSVQDLGPGKLTFGAQQLISNDFQGQVEARIPLIDPSDHADTSFFEFVVARIDLQANLETLAHLSAYIPGHPPITGGAGPFAVHVGMQKGKLSPETAITYATADVDLKGNGVSFKTDWKLDIGVGDEGATLGKPYVDSTSAATYVSVATYGKDAFTIQVLGHHEYAVLDSAQIGGETKVESARIHLPQIVSEDLDDLDSVVSKKTPIKSEAGHARASLTLDMDEQYRLKGPFRARIDGAALTFDQLRTKADASAASFVILDPDQDRASLTDLSVAIRNADFQAGKSSIDDWWLNLSSKRIDVAGLPADNVRADFAIVARDAEPVIRALAEDDKLPDIVADIVHLRNLRVLANVTKTQRTLDVMLDTMESKLIVDFSGRIHQTPKETRLALLIGGKDVALGISRRDNHTGFEAFADTAWLNEELSHFPKPKQYVSGDKP